MESTCASWRDVSVSNGLGLTDFRQDGAGNGAVFSPVILMVGAVIAKMAAPAGAQRVAFEQLSFIEFG